MGEARSRLPAARTGVWTDAPPALLGLHTAQRPLLHQWGWGTLHRLRSRLPGPRASPPGLSPPPSSPSPPRRGHPIHPAAAPANRRARATRHLAMGRGLRARSPLPRPELAAGPGYSRAVTGLVPALTPPGPGDDGKGGGAQRGRGELCDPDCWSPGIRGWPRPPGEIGSGLDSPRPRAPRTRSSEHPAPRARTRLSVPGRASGEEAARR